MHTSNMVDILRKSWDELSQALKPSQKLPASAKIYTRSWYKVAEKAKRSTLDAENMWLRVLHDTKIPKDRIRIEPAVVKDAPKAARVLQVYWLPKHSDVDEPSWNKNAKERLALTIVIVPPSAVDYIENPKKGRSWFGEIRDAINKQHPDRDRNVGCVFSYGRTATFRWLEPRDTKCPKLGRITQDSILDLRGSCSNKCPAWCCRRNIRMSGENLELKYPSHYIYAIDFLERSHVYAGAPPAAEFKPVLEEYIKAKSKVDDRPGEVQLPRGREFYEKLDERTKTAMREFYQKLDQRTKTALRNREVVSRRIHQ